MQNVSQSSDQHIADDRLFSVMEGVPAETNHYSMTWSSARRFHKEDHAQRYAAAMNEREERLRDLAYAWYGKAMEVGGDRDETHRAALAEAFDEFIEENSLDGEMRRALSRLLSNDMHANSYVVMPRLQETKEDANGV